jgi:hypothetical protein
MGKHGTLWIEEGETGVYVLLKMKLGWIALNIVTGNSYGGLQRTVDEVTYGLVPIGYRLDIDKTAKEGRQFQDL